MACLPRAAVEEGGCNNVARSLDGSECVAVAGWLARHAHVDSDGQPNSLTPGTAAAPSELVCHSLRCAHTTLVLLHPSQCDV